MKTNLKRVAAAVLLMILVICCTAAPAAADRAIERKPYNYIGAMRVAWVQEWVSLRAEPHKTSERLAKIPLGEVVYNCMDIKNDKFYQCEYKGQTGYVLKKYLRRAYDAEPPASSAVTKKMTMEEVIGSGEVVLEWQEFNMSVVAAHEIVKEKGKKWEVLRIGAFLDGTPLWGHEERVVQSSKYDLLKVFIGGVEDDYQVMLFDGGYGLSMLDLLNGREKWCVTVMNCPMGNGAVYTVDEYGTTYIAGTDGPDPVAISINGNVMWQSNVNNPGVFNPFEITVEGNTIQVKYESGIADGYKLVTMDRNGEVLSIRNQQTKASGE